jgi:nucleotide-binding universal stress UspA family protein
MFKILIPVDNTPFAEEIAPHVRDLVMRRDAETTLLNVLPDMVGYDQYVVMSAKSKALDRMHEIAGRIADTTIRCELRMGDPAREIMKMIAMDAPSVVAMPTHGRRGLDRLLEGSVAEQVLRHTNVPMLLTHHAGRSDTNRYARILVALDGSRDSERVLPMVEEVAITHGSEVVLFYDEPGVSDVGEVLGVRDAPQRLNAYADRLRKAGLDAHIEQTHTGRAADALLKRIRKDQVDLVAMTTHGREGIARITLGSVAEKVLRDADVTMLVQCIAPAANEQLVERYLG